MIRDRLPKDLNYVPPTDTIIEAIEELQDDMIAYKKYLAETVKSLAALRARINKLQDDFDLIKKYVE